MIDQDRAFHFVDKNGKSEGIGFSLARQRANDGQSAASIVGQIGQD